MTRTGFVALLILSGSVFSLFAAKMVQTPRVSPPSLMQGLLVEPSLLQDGDVVFRRGTSFASRMVLAADVESNYSHVGIVQVTSRGPIVIHATPGDDLDVPEPVRAESFEDFLWTENTTGLMIRRVKDAHVAERAAEIARSYVENSVFFDNGFDLASTEKLYCTELVWRAYREAGIDLIDGAFHRVDGLRFLLRAETVILPSDLLNSSFLSSVMELPPRS